MKVTNTVKPLNPDNPTMNDDYFLTASYNDCTGLTPTVAHNEYEAASYNEIAHYLPPIAPNPANNETSSDSLTKAEGIHTEVNTLDKNPYGKKGVEGNHLFPSREI